MQVTVLQPLYENDRHFQPGEALSTTPSRGWRLQELGLVKAPAPWQYDYKDEWADLRKVIGARPEGVVAFKTKRSRLDELKPGERFLIIRKYGGLGDILVTSMMFPDLLEQYPEIEVTYAPPKQYHALFEGTGLKLRAYEEVYSDTGYYHRGGVQAPILSQYELIEDISIPCHVWENFFVAYGGVDGGNGLKWRNRLDMWSRWFGLTVKHPRTIIRLRSDEIEQARNMLKGFGSGPFLLLAPFTGNRTKNYPWFLELARKLDKDWRVILLHGERPHWSIGYPILAGLSYRMMGAVCAAADMIVAADTSAFHWGGILKTPTVGIFNINDGDTYCAYYPTATSVQCCDTPCINVKYRNCSKHYQGDLPAISGMGLEMSKCYWPDTVTQIADKVRDHAGDFKEAAVRTP